MQKIVIPTDFSPISENALQYAIGLAVKFKSELCLYHVYRFRKKADYDWNYPKDEQPFVKRIEERMAFLKQKFVGRITQEGLDIQTVIEESDVFTFFKNTAIEKEFSLIIMGSKGATGLEKVLFGSTAATALDISKVPVLVVPPEHSIPAIKHIVFAIDQNEISTQTLSPLYQLASKFDAKVTVLTISTSSTKDSNRKNAAYLKGVETEYREVPMSKSINESIRAFIDKKPCDLLCMIKREKGFWDSIFKKSITMNHVYSPQIPFLVLPESD